jgi:hypothetical protein
VTTATADDPDQLAELLLAEATRIVDTRSEARLDLAVEVLVVHDRAGERDGTARDGAYPRGGPTEIVTDPTGKLAIVTARAA